MAKLSSVVDLQKSSLLGVEIEVLQTALDEGGEEALRSVASAMDLKLHYCETGKDNEDAPASNPLRMEDLNEHGESQTVHDDDGLTAITEMRHPDFSKISRIITTSRNFADSRVHSLKNSSDNEPASKKETQDPPKKKVKSGTKWHSIKSSNQATSQLRRTTSSRRGTYYGMYTKADAKDLRSRGRTASTSAEISGSDKTMILEETEEKSTEDSSALEKPGRDSAGNDSLKKSSSGTIREGRGWSNVVVRVREHVVSPVTKHFTSFAKMENFIELDIQPRSDNPLILFHDFDINTGMLWSFKRFSNALSQFRIREKSLCMRSPIEYILPQELVVEPKATVVDMTLDEYEAIKSDLNRQGGKRNFPLLVSETIAVLELLWSMKDNDDDLVICNPSYWMHSYISQLQVFTPNKQAHLKGSEDMYKFTDAIDKLLETRPGQTSFIHVRHIKETSGSKTAFVNAVRETSPIKAEKLKQSDDIAATLVRGYTEIDSEVHRKQLTKLEEGSNQEQTNENKDGNKLLHRFGKEQSFRGPIVPFMCKHVGSKIQIGSSCCRACSIEAYQRYASAASGDYSMTNGSLGDGESMFKVCLANGLIEEFKPYNARETSLLFITMALQNAYDVHPIYLSHDKHLYWNVIKYFGSCTQAIRMLLDPSVGDEIILSWACMLQ